MAKGKCVLWASLTIFVAALGSAETEPTRGKAEHVVLMVWDGMRPDFITEENTPNLSRLARDGVTFRKHHSVYPTLTNVNAAALATGVFPGRNGIIANWIFRPDLGEPGLMATDEPEIVRRGDEATGGKYITVPTIAELVQARGGRTAVAGSKGAALLHDRKSSPVRSATNSVSLFHGETIPAEAATQIAKLIGKLPKSEIPNQAQDAWTTRALTDVLWKEGLPEFSVLWMSDPDRSQHATGPGSEASLRGIRSVDENLGALLKALEEKKVREKTDVFVVSDHGFSTIARSVDMAAALRQRGFNVVSGKELELKRGEIKVAANAGSTFYYVGEHDADTVRRLADALQLSAFAGVIFSREEMAGTFRLADVHLDNVAGVDVAMSFHWNDGRNPAAAAGMIDANEAGNYKGTHGSLSAFDLHNTFIAAGPDFRREFVSELPTSNLDVAATIVHILGLKPPEALDGRIVAEALTSGEGAAAAVPEAKTLEASREIADGEWRQYLRTSKVGGSTYIDEGNGEFRRNRE